MRNLFSSLAILSLALLCACGPSADSGNTAKTPTSPTNTSGGATTPAAGVAGNTVTVESKNGAYPADLKFDTIPWAVAEYALGGDDEKVLFIYLSNTDLGDMKGVTLAKHKLSEGQGMLQFQLNRTDGPISTGTYKPDPTAAADWRVLPTIDVANGTSVQYNAHKSSGQLEVTELTKDTVAGTYDIRDDFSHVSGKFNAKIVTPAAEKKQ